MYRIPQRLSLTSIQRLMKTVVRISNFIVIIIDKIQETLNATEVTGDIGSSVEPTTRIHKLQRKVHIGPLGVSVSAITPTAIQLTVNVSSPSSVWCTTSQEGDKLNEDYITAVSRPIFVRCMVE